MEYIQYLQENNSKLLKKLNEMQENFDNKVCSTDTSTQYFLSTLSETLNICTILPQEIDSFFEKLSGAINTLKNILIIKSELVQLAEKISQLIKPYKYTSEQTSENNNIPGDVRKTSSAPFEKKEKGGTVKVSPMIEGHVISTEPKICLNRISKRQVPQNLSPIVETSPGSFSESPKDNEYCTREIQTPLPSLKISSDKLEKDQIKKKCKLPRNWMKNLTEEGKSDSDENTPVVETSYSKDSNKTDSTNQREIDPREGPSWLNDSCPISASINENFVSKKRRRNLFPTVFPELEISDARESAREKAELLLFVENEMINNDSENKIEDNYTPRSFNVSPICKTESLMSFTSQPKSSSDSQDSFQFINKTFIKKQHQDSNENAAILKQQPLVVLEDCLTSRSFSQELSNNSNLKVVNVSHKCNSKSDFCSSISSNEDKSEGRKRRKAAPTNLAEPPLKIKLRRE